MQFRILLRNFKQKGETKKKKIKDIDDAQQTFGMDAGFSLQHPMLSTWQRQVGALVEFC